MQSTLFTTLTANEEANLSGGNKPKKDYKSYLNLALALSKINQVGVGGDGGTAGKITITGGSAPVVIVKSPISADANGGSVTNNGTSNPTAVNAP
ncbi:hypothetical protein [Nostoc sp.]|uniref:hypothetical protein n=1 Tax=Nostoc sp. TaxID=1180 RepID=UPI002FF8CDA7